MSTLLSRINKMNEELKKNRENNNINNINNTNHINNTNNTDSTTTPKTTKSTKTAKNAKSTKTTKKSQPKQVQARVQQKTITPVAEQKTITPVANNTTPTITKKNMTKTQTITLTTQDYIDSIFRLIYYIYSNNKEGYGLTTTKITFSVLNNEISSITGIPENYVSNTENPQDTVAKDNKTGACVDVNGKTGIFNFAYNNENKLAMREFYKYCKNKLVEEGVDEALLKGSFMIDLDVLFELFKK